MQEDWFKSKAAKNLANRCKKEKTEEAKEEAIKQQRQFSIPVALKSRQNKHEHKSDGNGSNSKPIHEHDPAVPVPPSCI